MVISQKRIRNAGKYLSGFGEGQNLYVSVAAAAVEHERLEEVGFVTPLAVGNRVLPSALGPASRFNAEGETRVRKDLPKERRVIGQREWKWKTWSGRDRIPRSRIIDVVRPCYPIEMIPPPGLEIQVLETPGGALIIASDAVVYEPGSTETIIRLINVFLELFGECELLDESLESPLRSGAVRLNWQILPPGEYPWEVIEERLEDVVRDAPPGDRPVLWYRIGALERFHPTFHGVGRAGFRGYIVFGFPERGLFVLESPYWGNATYVLEKDWATISQMTKAEILHEQLHLARLIHRKGWEHELGVVLS